MIPFVTDNRTPPGPAPVALPQPGAGPRDGGAALDFAGLLPAARDAVASGPDAGSDPAALPQMAPVPVAPVALPPARLPNAMILPEPGTALPDSGRIMPEEKGLPDKAAIAAQSATDPAAAEALDVQAPSSEASPVPVQTIPPLAPSLATPLLAQAAPPAPARPAVRPLLNPAALSEKLAEAPLPATLAPTLTVPALAVAIDADPSAAPAATQPDALAEAAAPASPTPSSGPSLPAPAAAPAASAQSQPATAAAPAPAEARIAPQQDSAIAQVGELREALRAARPEMTLRHAEFGFVSLRVEATGAQDWRAVLASRDPGFVPAIQAALAERAISASSETSASNTGSHHGQSGQSDQRYGFSQGSGQGSSQPYMEQSGKRDEGASSHQRQQRSDAEEAARAKGPDAEQHAPRDRGLFA
jgi:hypothetical protein